VSIAPVQPPIGLFASPTWTDPLGESYEVVVYNSLVVDRESKSSSSLSLARSDS